MVFSSIIFLFLFLPVTLSVYFLVPKRFRNHALFLVSIIFYAWGEVFYVIVMLASITVNYLSGLLLERFINHRLCKSILFITIAINLGLLFTFKYANFFVENINLFFSAINVPEIVLDPVHLPIGISFFTFQALSYVIDIYRRQVPAQKNPINMGLFISSFPQLIAGPIIRYHDIARQLIERTVTRYDFTEGVERFIFGLGKKVLIANTMAITADRIFAVNVNELTCGLAWLGIICYTLQIYFDFSGYSDMAIGLGRMFGFRFKENFNYPYMANSMREFWRRWHISLSSWFRDYLYIPLGGNRRGTLRTYINLVAVFSLVGFWHGASWNFLVWGLFHGSFLVIERLAGGNWVKKIWAPFRHMYVLLVVIIGWVFFRAESLSDSLCYLLAMLGSAKGAGLEYHVFLYLDSITLTALFTGTICSIPLIPYLKKWMETLYDKSRDAGYSYWVGTLSASISVTLSLILFASVLLLAVGSYNPFIYFRF